MPSVSKELHVDAIEQVKEISDNHLRCGAKCNVICHNLLLCRQIKTKAYESDVLMLIHQGKSSKEGACYLSPEGL